MIGIYIPTIGRPTKLAPLSSNIHEVTKLPHEIFFILEPDDEESKKAVMETKEKYLISEKAGSHTGAANTAYRKLNHPYFIVANDDFWFHSDWDTKSMEKMNDTTHVVGLSDYYTKRYHTIFLIKRSYIKEQSGVMDKPDTLFHEGYHHNYVDTEFFKVAERRGVFTPCPGSIVEHRHYGFQKSPFDKIYEKSNLTSALDLEIYNSRKHLWGE